MVDARTNNRIQSMKKDMMMALLRLNLTLVLETFQPCGFLLDLLVKTSYVLNGSRMDQAVLSI